jgi:hypothetical protein
MAEPGSTYSQAVGGTAELVHLRPEVRSFLSNSGADEATAADAILAAVALAADAYRHGATRVTIRWHLIKAGVRVEVEDRDGAPSNARPRARIVHSHASRGQQREPAASGTPLAWTELTG